jgi:WH2 motif
MKDEVKVVKAQHVQRTVYSAMGAEFDVQHSAAPTTSSSTVPANPPTGRHARSESSAKDAYSSASPINMRFERLGAASHAGADPSPAHGAAPPAPPAGMHGAPAAPAAPPVPPGPVHLGAAAPPVPPPLPNADAYGMPPAAPPANFDDPTAPMNDGPHISSGIAPPAPPIPVAPAAPPVSAVPAPPPVSLPTPTSAPSTAAAAPPVPAAAGGRGDLLSQIQAGAQLRSVQVQPRAKPADDPRTNLLSQIRDIKGRALRHVEVNKKKEAPQAFGLGATVASILARRAAIQGSDDDTSDESGSDWED